MCRVEDEFLFHLVWQFFHVGPRDHFEPLGVIQQHDRIFDLSCLRIHQYVCERSDNLPLRIHDGTVEREIVTRALQSTQRDWKHSIFFWRIPVRAGHIELSRFFLLTRDGQYSGCGAFPERTRSVRFLTHTHEFERRDQPQIVHLCLNPIARLKRAGADSKA